MNLKNKATILGLVFTCMGLNGSDGMRYIASEELFNHMDHVTGKSQPKWYLINVLPRYVANECMISGSINIPVHILEKRLKDSKKWRRDRKIVLCCLGNGLSESRLSMHAYEITKKLGFTDAVVLKGGMAGWKRNRYPMVGKCAMDYLGS